MPSKFTTLLYCFVFLGISSVSAQNEVDSLRSLLENQENDTSKVITHLRLYEVLKLKDPEQALQNLDKSLKLSIDLNYKKGTFKALMSLADQLTTYSDYDSALALFQKAQTVAVMLDDRKGTMDAMIGQGFSYSSLQRLEDADTIAYSTIEIASQEPVDSLIMTSCYTILSNTAYFRSLYQKSIEFDQKGLLYNTKDLSKRAKSLLNIGTIHSVLLDRDLSFEYYFKALEEAKKADDDHMKASVYLELGTEYTHIKDFELARKNFTKSMEYFVKINDKRKIAYINQSFARIHADLNEFDLALEKYRLALQQVDEINSPYQKAHLHFLLGMTYVKIGGSADAINEFKQAQMLFQQIQNSNMARWSAFKLSEIYETEGNFEKAYRYLQEVKKLDDSTFTATSAKNVAEVEEKYQNEQKQKEIELLNAENEIATLEIRKQEDLRNYLIIGAFLLVLLIGVIYSRYQLKARANAKLKELDSLKTNFFTNISHEFRTPLTLILSPLQRLVQKNMDQETQEALSIIHRNATVLTELTNQLLDLSKLEAGELDLKVSQSDFKSFIKVICASFESLAVAQKIEFIQDIESAPTQAYFDEDKVQKILNNLLSNAFKFTSDQGKVSIGVSKDNEQLVISIQDNGRGITPENQELIFKRFHQNNTNQPSTTGTGVGLTLSKELAILHKGDIKVESEPGQGSKFVVQFPISKAAYRPKEISLHETQLLGIEPLNVETSSNEDVKEVKNSEQLVLVVEDNLELRNHMTSLLKEDFNVKQSTNGKKGIEDAINLVPDIIITDLMMPKVDGVELCNTLKANDKTSHIPIIMLTAKADRDTKLDGLKTGADDFLTKPFDNEELQVRVQNLITLREKLQSKYQQTLRLEPSKIEVKSPDEIFIKKALQVVDQHLSNSEFTVEMFQKEMAMSRMQLHRKLKALTNLATSEFVRDIRLQRAADLLAQNGVNITEVAYSCGFNSISYFAQCFKQKFGVSPSGYSIKHSESYRGKPNGS